VFLLANHGQPWRWMRWRYFGGRLEKLVEFGGKKRKLVVMLTMGQYPYTCIHGRINTYVYIYIYIPV